MKLNLRRVMVIAIMISAFSGAAHCDDVLSEKGGARRVTDSKKLDEKQITNVILAIQDEIYDYEKEKKFYRVGTTAGSGVNITTKINIYVRPYLDKSGGGEMIYKDMPYGEILRVFHFKPSGLVILDNDPELGFPLSEPSHLTLFMDDDELCEDKSTWMRLSMIVADSPPLLRVISAAARQQNRVGFSAYLTKHPSEKAK